MRVIAEVVAGLHRVVAQEVHRLAHFGDGVGKGLAGFANQQPHQRLDFCLHQVGGTLQNRGALCRRGGLPDRRRVDGALDGVVHVGDRSFLHMAYHIAVVCRVQHRYRSRLTGGAGQQRAAFQSL